MSLSNPNIPQGTLTRLRAGLLWNDIPNLNVTPAFLGKAGIEIGFEGNFTTQIETMTGIVQSAEPFVQVSVTINLLRTQALAAAYMAQANLNTVFGDCTVRPDVGPGALQPFPLYNMAWQSLRALSLAGQDPGFVIAMHGYMNINSGLWNT